jgi:hypothetical protein
MREQTVGHTCTHTHTRAMTHAQVHTHTHTSTHRHTQTHTKRLTCSQGSTLTRLQARNRFEVNMRVQAVDHTCTHAHTHTYTHANTGSWKHAYTKVTLTNSLAHDQACPGRLSGARKSADIEKMNHADSNTRTMAGRQCHSIYLKLEKRCCDLTTARARRLLLAAARHT